MATNTDISQQIRAASSERPLHQKLKTSERVLARITDGIYRQPASALRELVSNSYDADATDVHIITDAPVFDRIIVKDNGIGISPEAINHLLFNIGGSAKRTDNGQSLKITSKSNSMLSPMGRTLIGKMGIGLFSVAQLTRHFIIYTKTKEDEQTTILDVVLSSPYTSIERESKSEQLEIETGSAKIWRTENTQFESSGTEIHLIDLLPRTKSELQSEDYWTRIDQDEKLAEGMDIFNHVYHLGRVKNTINKEYSVEPNLPWNDLDPPDTKFFKLIDCVSKYSIDNKIVTDIKKIFDNYLYTLWCLSLWCPVRYCQIHPFDLDGDSEVKFFQISGAVKGQAVPLQIQKGSSLRDVLGLTAKDGATQGDFSLYVDGIELFRPIRFDKKASVKDSKVPNLLFVGRHKESFKNVAPSMTGGDLEFEAYLLKLSRVVPQQHQGVILRVGNASGAIFDPTFMGYSISEQSRLRQITCEIFVSKGLDGAINLDRESFNYSHPHYQIITAWLHSALRQLANKDKEINKTIRQEDRSIRESISKEVIQKHIEAIYVKRSNTLPDNLSLSHVNTNDGLLDNSFPSNFVTTIRNLFPIDTQDKIEQAKAVYLILHAWGLIDNLPADERAAVVSDIITVFDN